MERDDKNHKWKFVRAGGLDQVVFRNGADIVHLDQLDQKLWVALACPTKGVEFDPKTLEILDTDGDGRIRVPEIVAAIRWLRDVLKNPDELLGGGDSVSLDAINDQNPVGASLLAGARRILTSLGKPAASAITLAEVTDTEKVFDAKNFNGDGIVPADTAPTEALAKAIEDIVSTHGSAPDRSGKAGIDKAIVDAFFADARAFSEWHAKGEADDIRTLTTAAQAVAAVRAKIDDYFARCRLAALDPRGAALLGASDADLLALSNQTLSNASEGVARLPIARIEAGRPLPLAEGVNPAWSAGLAALTTQAVESLIGTGRNRLTEEEWSTLVAKVAAHQAWLDAKPKSAAEKLGLERVRELLGTGVQESLDDLIARDLAVSKEMEQIDAVEKLVRLQRDIVALLNNFVSFSAFYSKSGAIFQAGTLYLDGRACDLCIRVEDAGKHAALAGLAKTYLAYCDCVRRGTGQSMTIAAAFTDGDSDNLMVGRNGVFYDRLGNDWDATITKVIENPISIRQAFFAPYKSFLRMIEQQVAKRAADADAAANTHLKAAAEATATADVAKPEAAPVAKKMDVGTVAAIGVAVGSIGTFLSGMLNKFFDLGAWVPVGLIGLVLAISGPSMLIAWLKLRLRNLGPILDANGWAVNGRVNINVPFGGALTSLAVLPAGSERSLTDPYAVEKRPWGAYVTLAVLVVLGGCWFVGRLDRYLPQRIRSTTVMGTAAPSAPATPAAAPAAAPQ